MEYRKARAWHVRHDKGKTGEAPAKTFRYLRKSRFPAGSKNGKSGETFGYCQGESGKIKRVLTT